MLQRLRNDSTSKLPPPPPLPREIPDGETIWFMKTENTIRTELTPDILRCDMPLPVARESRVLFVIEETEDGEPTSGQKHPSNPIQRCPGSQDGIPTSGDPSYKRDSSLENSTRNEFVECFHTSTPSPDDMKRSLLSNSSSGRSKAEVDARELPRTTAGRPESLHLKNLGFSCNAEDDDVMPWTPNDSRCQFTPEQIPDDVSPATSSRSNAFHNAAIDSDPYKKEPVKQFNDRLVGQNRIQEPIPTTSADEAGIATRFSGDSDTRPPIAVQTRF